MLIFQNVWQMWEGGRESSVSYTGARGEGMSLNIRIWSVTGRQLFKSYLEFELNQIMEYFPYKLIKMIPFFLGILNGSFWRANMLFLVFLIFLSEDLFKQKSRRELYFALGHIWTVSQESGMHALINPPWSSLNNVSWRVSGFFPFTFPNS